MASLAVSGADNVGIFTITYAEEAAGFALAAKQVGIPALVSFTLETDGKLPSGQTLSEAIEFCDQHTEAFPQCYAVNCAHPTHCEPAFRETGSWRQRFGAYLANASSKSHAELETSKELDEGDPLSLSKEIRSVLRNLENIQLLGGCCGTDSRHVAAIAKAVFED